jgi:hypothetical protein
MEAVSRPVPRVNQPQVMTVVLIPNGGNSEMAQFASTIKYARYTIVSLSAVLFAVCGVTS